MKEIAEGIWNAPKEQVYQWISDTMMFYCIGGALGLVAIYFLHKYIKNKMGFGKEWDDKWKAFDERMKNF